MTTVPLLHRLYIVATLMLMTPALSYALSIYDVIQLSKKNYSDQDIVSLIQATESAFTLKAEDIVRLQGMGLSEPVIQAMVTAIPEETRISPPASYSAPPPDTVNTPTHVEHTPASNIQVKAATTPVAPAKAIAGGYITIEPFQETGSGHHHHNAVNLAGVRLLVIRDEGLFPSVETRATAIAKRLEQAVSMGKGSFHPGPATTSSKVMFYERNADKPVLILNVSHSDAHAYQLRSGRTVTPALLAAYWSDLLSDYWSIAINQSAPDRLSALHEGEVLNALYEQWGKANETESIQLADAVKLLPRQQQQHLSSLAITVPHDFLISDSHLAKQP